jgi:hypothetical protein
VLTSVSGGDTTTPVDGTPAIASELASTDSTPGSQSISPATSDALLVCACSAHYSGGVARTMTHPSGMTELEDFPSASAFEIFGAAALALSSSGATGEKVWAPSATMTGSDAWLASSIAIKSGSAGTDADAEAATGTGTANDATVETVPGQSVGPATDITTTGWTATGGTGSLASAIDETPADDGDFITSPPNPSSSVVEVKFATVTDPGVSDGHRFDYRVRVLNAGSYSVTAALFQGGTQIATETRTTGLTSSFQTFTLTLSGGEADAITDYTDLRLRVTATAAA